MKQARFKPFASDGAFGATPSTAGGDLRRATVRSAGATILAGGSGLATQVIATVILARLLTPRDFGVVAMVTTFSLLIASIGDNGLPEAIVQREKMDHQLASNLFWVSAASGLLLTVAFALGGSLIASIYHDAAVKRIAIGVSLTIVLQNLSVLHLSLLKRAMKFYEVSLVTMAARGVSVAVSILLARAGFGYWSLVGGAVALPASLIVGAWYFCCWLPGPPRKSAGTWAALKFAMNTYGRFGVNYCTRNIDHLLVGWRFHAQSLGFYKKAYDLFALSATQSVSALTLVVVAALSRLDKQSAQFERYLRGALSLMACVGMGLAAALTLVGRDLIRVLLGPGWEETGRIFTYFGPGVGAMIVYHTSGWIHLSLGRADRWLRWGILELGFTSVLFAIGLSWGPVGIALAWTASFWLLMIPAIWYAGRPIQLTIRSVLADVWRYIGAAGLALALAKFIVGQIPLPHASDTVSAMIRLSVVAPLVATLYFAAIVLLYGSMTPVSRILRLLRDFRQPREPLILYATVTDRRTPA